MNTSIFKSKRLPYVLSLLVFFVASYFAIIIMPMNMDEAGIYHALACIDHPLAVHNQFREACYNKNELLLWGSYSLFRPQFYTGIFHSLLYAPFYFLFHNQIVQYLFGLFAFVGFAALCARRSHNFLMSFSIYISSVPLLVQFVHDTGPVKYVMLLYPLSAFCIDRMLNDRSKDAYIAAFSLGLLYVCAFEEKAFFLYLLLPIVLFGLSFAKSIKSVPSLWKHVRHSIFPLSLFAGVTAFGYLSLMFATNINGDYYVTWLINLVGQKADISSWLGTLFDYLLFWSLYGHNIYDLDVFSLFALAYKALAFFFFITAISFAVSVVDKFDFTRFKWSLLGASFVLQVVIFGFIRNTWAGHHFIYLWPVLMVCFVELLNALPQTRRLILFGFYLLLNLLVLAFFATTPYLAKVDPEKDAIVSYLSDDNRASTSIYNFTTWGAYYIQALYGPQNQLATYTEPFEANPSRALYPQAAQSLLSLSAQMQRRIYVVCHGPSLCSLQDVGNGFMNQIQFEDMTPAFGNWKLYRALTVPADVGNKSIPNT